MLKEKRGFMFENVEELMPGYKAKTFDDFCDFLCKFGSGTDEYRSSRIEINGRLNAHCDNNNSKRLLKALNIL